MNITHRQLVAVGPLTRGFRENPQTMESLSQLRVRGQHSLHQLHILSSRGDRITHIRGGKAHDQIQPAQRTVCVYVADGIGLTAGCNDHRLLPGQAVGLDGVGLLIQFLQVRAGQQVSRRGEIERGFVIESTRSISGLFG